MTRKKEVRETTIKKYDNYIHIETDGCVINIRPGLTNDKNLKVTSVMISGDGNDGKGHVWKVIDPTSLQMYCDGTNIRVIKLNQGDD